MAIWGQLAATGLSAALSWRSGKKRKKQEKYARRAFFESAKRQQNVQTYAALANLAAGKQALKQYDVAKRSLARGASQSRQDIKDSERSALGAADSSNVSRGLYNTSARDNQRTGIRDASSRALGGVNQQLARQMSNLDLAKIQGIRGLGQAKANLADSKGYADRALFDYRRGMANLTATNPPDQFDFSGLFSLFSQMGSKGGGGGSGGGGWTTWDGSMDSLSRPNTGR